MTQRRPAHETVPDFVERQIREAHDRGDFDGLPGHGRPIAGLGRPDDELWWVRRKLRDEQLVGLPPALQARRDRDDAMVAIRAASSEGEVRRILAEVNDRIRTVNRTTVVGPPPATMPLDVEAVVAEWCAYHPPSGTIPAPTRTGAIDVTSRDAHRLVATTTRSEGLAIAVLAPVWLVAAALGLGAEEMDGPVRWLVAAMPVVTAAGGVAAVLRRVKRHRDQLPNPVRQRVASSARTLVLGLLPMVLALWFLVGARARGSVTGTIVAGASLVAFALFGIVAVVAWWRARHAP